MIFWISVCLRLRETSTSSAIARALINSPKVILADEPTGNLDSHNSDEIVRLIFDLRKKYKQTFVIVTHNDKFASMTDRTLKMMDGSFV